MFSNELYHFTKKYRDGLNEKTLRVIIEYDDANILNKKT